MPFYLYVGPNAYLKEKALNDLRVSLVKSAPQNLDYKVFHVRDTGLSQVLDYINTIPFLSPHKVVVVKDVENLAGPELARLAECLKKNHKTTHVIMDVDEEADSADMNKLVERANIKRFDNLTDAQFQVWAKNYVKSNSGNNKSITYDAIRELRQLHGENLFILSNELDKIIAYTKDSGEIKLKDVEDVAGRSLLSSAFDLTKAIEKNNINDAFRIISDLIISGKKHYEIIGLLCWHIKRLLRAKILQSNGQSEHGIAYALKIGRAYQEEFFRQVKALKTTELRDKLNVLLDADLDIKRTRFDPTLVLEFVIIKLCLR